ncbi:membrane protein [Staphylococcus aureus]|nr:membrane protein [Staphylococcus aureus]CAC8225420.1 membrane protein [Staphylococcus aureus]CAC8257182.1 membrane protein [Staphylococcus aureus]CAC8261021.1 membrane protein [Staphylococcus aureus]CAC8264066.1 membrane protein [Staphylococcus aureus]
MAENNQNSLVTKIATYGSFIAIASFVILFISIFLKFSFNIEFTANNYEHMSLHSNSRIYTYVLT